MAVIELGTLGAGGDLPASGRARRYPRVPVRRVAAVLVTVLCLATVHASAVPRARGLTGTWSMAFAAGDAFEPSGGNVVVLRDGSPQVLAAYALATGTPRWSFPVPYPVTALTPVDSAGVLLLPAQARSVGIRTAAGDVLWAHYSTLVVALDANTGRELWRAAGDVALTTADGVLLAEHEPDGLGARTLRLVGLRDGATRWSRDGRGAYRWATVGGGVGRPDTLVTATPEGDLRVYRFADGAVRTAARVPWRAGSLSDAAYSDIAGHGDLLYVFTASPEGTTATAYAPGTLRRLWSVTAEAGAGPSACGAVLCLPTGNGLAARDWRTGAELWRVAGYDLGRPLAGHLLLVGGEDAGRAVVDDRTGRILADLGAGGVAWAPDGGIVVTLVPTRSPPDRIAVGRLDPRTGEEFLLGTVDPVVNSFWCRVSGVRLACTTPRSRLIVTDVG